MQMNEPRRLFQDDKKKVVVIFFAKRDRGRNAERADDFRQRVGMPNDKDAAAPGLEFRDQGEALYGRGDLGF